MLISNWLSSLVSRIRRRPRYNSRARRAMRKRWEAAQQNSMRTVDPLEDRVMLTTTIFLDFGEGFASGGLQTTVYDFLSVDGFHVDPEGNLLPTGPYLNQAGNSDVQLGFNGDLTLSALKYDFDGNGFEEANDLAALAASVKELMEEVLEPFDIDVQIASATSLIDVRATLRENDGIGDGDDNGENDAYVFVTEMWSTVFGDSMTGSVGSAIGAYGIAAAADLIDDSQDEAYHGNKYDESVQVFADVVFKSIAGVEGTAEFNESLVQRLAYTSTHEAFHTFSLHHSAEQLSAGDVILEGVENTYREFPYMVTRFDLPRSEEILDPNISFYSIDNYEIIANDHDIGLRDDNRNLIPDLAYVTGTGAHDRITLTQIDADTVSVTVTPYHDSLKTQHYDDAGQLVSETYTIDLNLHTEGKILIDAGMGDDEFVIDFNTDAFSIELRGGGGTDVLKFIGDPDFISHSVDEDFDVVSEFTTSGSTVALLSEDIELIDDRNQQLSGAVSTASLQTGSQDNSLNVYSYKIDGAEAYFVNSGRKTVGFYEIPLTVDTGAGSDSITVFDDLSLSELHLAAESIILHADTITTMGDQTYDGAVTLAADTNLSGENVTFNGSVNASITDFSKYEYQENIPYDWEDISGTGTSLTLTLDNDTLFGESGFVNLGFNFEFFGNAYTGLSVNPHGYVTFTPGQTYNVFDYFGENAPGYPPEFPDAILPNNLIAGYWSVLDIRNGGQVYVEELTNAAGEKYFIIQYDSVPHFTNSTLDNPAPVSFQIKLYEQSNQIEIHYRSAVGNLNTDRESSLNHRVGIENADGSDGTQIFEGGGSFPLSAIRFTPDFSEPAPDASLTVNTTNQGTVTFNGEVGGITGIGNVTTAGDGSTVVNADLNLNSGHQLQFQNDVFIESAVTFTAPQVQFYDSVQGMNRLTLDPSTNVSFEPGSAFRVAINGTAPGSGYDQYTMTDAIDLSNATLEVVFDSFVPGDNTSYTIIRNESGAPFVGTFSGLPEGADVVFGSTRFRISYVGGDGNDVVLTANSSDPLVTSVVRFDAAVNNDSTVVFRVYYSEQVSGVDQNDFVLTTTGNLDQVSIESVNHTAAYTQVTVNTGTNTGVESGTLRLDVIDDDSIVDIYGNPLGGTDAGNGTYESGEEYTIDFVAPPAPVIVGIVEDTGLSDSDGITTERQLSFYGTAEAGSTIKVRRSDTDSVVKTAVADAFGNWTTPKSSYLNEGDYSFYATATDVAGNLGSESAEYDVSVDLTGETPTITGLTAGDSGLQGDRLTNEETFTIAGYAEANSAVTVYLDETLLATVTANAFGQWSLEHTVVGSGEYVFYAEMIDVVGHLSPLSTGFTVTVDSVSEAPVITGVIDDTGIDGTNHITRDQQLTLKGTAEANSSVEVYRTDLAVPVSIGSTTSDSEGNWTLAYNQTLAAGTTASPATYTFNATTEDASGNAVSALSEEYAVQIVNDSEEGAEVRVELRVVQNPTNTPQGTNGEVTELPDSELNLQEWQGYWVEIWLSTPYTFDAGTPGIKSADVDLTYLNHGVTSATQVEFGEAFSLNQNSVIDDSQGIVQHISASTSASGLGVSAHLLFARVKFEALEDDEVLMTVNRTIDPENSSQMIRSLDPQNPGFDLTIHNIVNGSDMTLDPTSGGAHYLQGAEADLLIYPNIYDFDDNGSVNFRDLIELAAKYNEHLEDEVGDSSTDSDWQDEVWKLDYDKNGEVNFRDLINFAANYNSSKSNPTEWSYPSGSPTDWINSVSMITGESTNASDIVVTQTMFNENDGTLTIELTNTKQLDSGVTVGLDVSGSLLGIAGPDSATDNDDFESYSGFVEFTGTANEKQYLTLQLTNDDIVEYDEKLYVILNEIQYSGAGDISFQGAEFSILNDDQAEISISDAIQSEGGAISFEVTLDHEASEPVTVTASLQMGTTDSADFVDVSNITVYFAPGETSKTITYTLVDDSIVEGDEQFQVILSDARFNGETDESRVIILNDTGTGTLTDNDAATLSIDNVTVNEEAGTAVFTVTLDQEVQGGVTVDWSTADGTAVAGSDYTSGSGRLNFTGTAGETQTISVTLTDDSEVESAENLLVNLDNLQAGGLNVSLADSQGVATINASDSISFSGTATADDFLLQLNADGVTLELWNDTTLVYSGLLTDYTEVNINGGAGVDTLTIDLSNGLPFPLGNINFDGDVDGGEIILEPGSYAGPLNTVTHSLSSETAGTINIDGQLIQYTGVGSLLDQLSVTNRVFDFLGAGETVTVSDDGTADDGLSLIDSTLGAAVTYAGSGTVTVKTDDGSGSDTISILGLDGLIAGDLTISGDSDDDVAFQTNTIAMGAHALTVDARTITVESGISATSGAISLTASRNLLLTTGSSLTTVDGGISLIAHAGGGILESFDGIDVNGATISSTGTGTILLDGSGGDQANTSSNYGVGLRGGAVISSTSVGADAGTINLIGQGGAGDSFNYGIGISGATITSVMGDISLNGTGGGDGSENYNVGINLRSSEISSTGTGTEAAAITLTGQGGFGLASMGIATVFTSDYTTVESVDGDIQFFGSGGDGLVSAGILMGKTTFSSTGTGIDAADILLAGTVTAPGGIQVGGFVASDELTVNSSAGDISIQSNEKLTLSADTLISSTSGNISLTAADASVDHQGSIEMEDGARIDAGSGDLTLLAEDRLEISGLKTTGTVTLISENSSIIDAGNTYLDIEAGAAVLSAGMSVGSDYLAQMTNPLDTVVANLEGDAGYDFYVSNTGDLILGNAGAVTGITATRSIEIDTTGSLSVQEDVSSTGLVSSSDHKYLELTAESISVDATISTSKIKTRLLADRTIVLNSGSSLTTIDGGIQLTANSYGNETGNFTGIEADNASIVSTGAGYITMSGYAGDDAASDGLYGIKLHSGTVVSSTATGVVTMSGSGGDGGSNNFGLYLNDVSLSLNQGYSTLIGWGGNGTGSDNRGIQIDSGTTITSTGTGSNAARITLQGIGGSSVNGGYGINVSNPASLITSVDGDISLQGWAGTGSGGNQMGVVFNGAGISSTGTGQYSADITISGFGGAGTNSNRGILLNDANVASLDGNVTLTGQGGNSTGVENFGVSLNETTVSIVNGNLSIDGLTGSAQAGTNFGTLLAETQITSSGTGTITISGEGGDGTSSNSGVGISGTEIESYFGDIQVTGQGGLGSSTNNLGIFMYNGSMIASLGTGETAASITLDGTGGTGSDYTRGLYLYQSDITTIDGGVTLIGQGGGFSQWELQPGNRAG